MKKTLLILALLIIVVVGGYFLLQPQSATAPTPTVPASSPVVHTQSTDTVQKPPADVGAGGVYDPNTPTGSSAECAQCGQYTGSQKAQCLAALNCQ